MYRNRILISMILIISMLVPTISSFAIQEDNLPYEFNISAIYEEGQTDLSDIEIKVYTSELVQDMDGIKEYAHTYSHSVYTDEDGQASFSVSHDHFYISINTESLPEGIGTDRTSAFYAYGQDDEIFILSDVDTVELDDDDGEYTVNAYNEEGEQINVFSTIDIVPDASFENNISLLNITDIYEVPCTVNATVAGKQYTFDSIQSLTGTTEEERIQELYDNGCIDEDKKNNLENGLLLTAEAQSQSRDLPTYTSPAYYYSSHFKIFYDESMTYAVAQSLALAFEDLYIYFCSSVASHQYDFPQSEPLDSRYHIYIDNNISTTSVAEISYSMTVLTKISVSYSSACTINEEDADAELGALAATFYRAIMIDRAMYSTWHSIGLSEDWMRYAFSMLIGCVYKNAYKERISSDIGYYLSYTDTDILFEKLYHQTDSKQRGSMLFPLYVYENFGGLDAIHDIIDGYFPLPTADPNGDYYPQIMLKIRDKCEENDVSFSDYFTTCATYNYEPSYFYTTAHSGWQMPSYNRNSVHMSTCGKGITTTQSVSIETLSSTYFELLPVNYTNSNIVINVSVDADTNSDPRMRYILESSNGTYTTGSLSNSNLTLEVSNFGALRRKVILVAANAAMPYEHFDEDHRPEVEFSVSTSVLRYIPGNNCLYRIRNVGSGKYVNVCYGNDYDGNNVYQYTADESDEQNFRLESVNPTKYRIRTLCSSGGMNRVLDIVKINGSLASGGNVQIYRPVDDVAQNFVFAPVHTFTSDAYYIRPYSNQNLSLTSYGDNNGTGGGTTPTSDGNIFISTYNSSDDNQKWVLEPIPDD